MTPRLYGQNRKFFIVSQAMLEFEDIKNDRPSGLAMIPKLFDWPNFSYASVILPIIGQFPDLLSPAKKRRHVKH